MRFQITRLPWITVGVLGCVVAASDAMAQGTTVNYGRITAVRQVELRNPDAQATGALLGGLAGLATGSGQSSSNRALRSLGGAAIGGRVGAAAGSSTGFEYTVLINGTDTIRIVTEKAGLRVRDCVSVERGAFNNIRLAADERCEVTAATVPQQAAAAASACVAAKEQLLNAETDEDFDRAERRVRLLCD
jgi:outer membrane lipoprotein SlyB